MYRLDYTTNWNNGKVTNLAKIDDRCEIINVFLNYSLFVELFNDM